MNLNHTRNRKKWNQAVEVIKANADQWPEIIARRDVEKFSGGAYSSRTMANLDCLGKGPDGAFRLGKTVMYSKQNLVTWLLDRLSVR